MLSRHLTTGLSIIFCLLIQTTLGSPRSGSPASHSLIRHPTHSAQTSHPTPHQTLQTPPQSTTVNQTATQIPTKALRAPRPSSTSSIPISGAAVSTKTNVIFRNKTNAGNQQSSQTLVDKIKQYNKSGQQTVNGEQNIPQITANGRAESTAWTASTVSKRTSGSSGFSSAKSDSSASLCGIEASVSTVVANASAKAKPSVTQTVSKTRTSNYSQNSANTANTTNTCLSLNSNADSNSHINNNSSNHKKSEETVANCENIKTNVSNKGYNATNASNTSAKFGSIPVKRIQPPRSRPTSTIIDTNSVASAMACSSHSTSNTSLTAIAKPSAAVKGMSKVLPHEDSSNKTASRKLYKQENQSMGAPEHWSDHNSQNNANSKIKYTSDKSGIQTQSPIPGSKPEPSIAMVSPIMAREQNAKCKTIEEEKCPNEQKRLSHKQNSVLKKSDKQIAEDKKKETHIVGHRRSQSPPETAMQDSIDSSHAEGDESASNSDVDSSLINIKPMPPLVRTSQFAFLRSNANHVSNGTLYQRFPNNYSAIENGYLSDSAPVNSGSRPVYRGYYSVAGSATGYASETDACSPYFRRNKLLSSKTDHTSRTQHRHYPDTDRSSVVNIQ